jgi:hypothetical protein
MAKRLTNKTVAHSCFISSDDDDVIS